MILVCIPGYGRSGGRRTSSVRENLAQKVPDAGTLYFEKSVMNITQTAHMRFEAHGKFVTAGAVIIGAEKRTGPSDQRSCRFGEDNVIAQIS